MACGCNLDTALTREEKLQKKRTSTTRLRVEALDWLGNRDSNPNKQSQSLSCYRYTIPQNFTVVLLYPIFLYCQDLFENFLIFVQSFCVKTAYSR